MAKEVKVPVKVTGSKQAQSELKQTGDAVKGVGAAGAQSATGTNQASEAVKRHAKQHKNLKPPIDKNTKAINQFDDSAKTAITGILGQFSPMLASLANIAVDVAKGFTKITSALVGMLAIGVVVSGLIALFGKIKEAAQVAEEALKAVTEAREEFKREQQEPAGRIAGDLERLGAYSPENFRKAFALYVEAMARGVSEAKAAGLAAVSQQAKLTPQEVGLLAAANVEPETTKQARAALDELRAKPKVQREIEQAAAAAKGAPAGRAAMAQAVRIRREEREQTRFWEEVAGVSHDTLLLAMAREAKLVDEYENIERVDELLKEAGRLRLRFRGGPGYTAPWIGMRLRPLSKEEQKRLETLRPLLDVSDALKAAGVADTSGVLRDVTEAAPTTGLEPQGFSAETQKVIVNINKTENKQETTINQGTVINTPADWLEIKRDSLNEFGAQIGF